MTGDAKEVCDLMWLEDSLVLYRRGLVITGPELGEYGGSQWPLRYSPLPREISVPGIFVVGIAESCGIGLGTSSET